MRTCPIRVLSLCLTLVMLLTLAPAAALAAPAEDSAAYLNKDGQQITCAYLHDAVLAAKSEGTNVAYVLKPVVFGQNGEADTTILLDKANFTIIFSLDSSVTGTGTLFEISEPNARFVADGKGEGRPGYLSAASAQGTVHVLAGGCLTTCSAAIRATGQGDGLVVDQGGSVNLPDHIHTDGGDTNTISAEQGTAVVNHGSFASQYSSISGSGTAIENHGSLLLNGSWDMGVPNHISGAPCVALEPGSSLTVSGANMYSFHDNEPELVDNRPEAQRKPGITGGYYSHDFLETAGQNPAWLLSEHYQSVPYGDRFQVVYNGTPMVKLDDEAFGSVQEALDGLPDDGKAHTMILMQDLNVGPGEALPVMRKGRLVLKTENYAIGSNGKPGLEVAGGTLVVVTRWDNTRKPFLKITGGQVHLDRFSPYTIIDGNAAVYLESTTPKLQKPRCGIVFLGCSRSNFYDNQFDPYNPAYRFMRGTVYGDPDLQLSDIYCPSGTEVGTDLDEYVTLKAPEKPYQAGQRLGFLPLEIHKKALSGDLSRDTYETQADVYLRPGTTQVLVRSKSDAWSSEGVTGSKYIAVTTAGPTQLELTATNESLDKDYDGTTALPEHTDLRDIAELKTADRSFSPDLEYGRDYILEAAYDSAGPYYQDVTIRATLLDTPLARCFTLPEPVLKRQGYIRPPELPELIIPKLVLPVDYNKEATYTVDLAEEFCKAGNENVDKLKFSLNGGLEWDSYFGDGKNITLEGSILTVQIPKVERQLQNGVARIGKIPYFVTSDSHAEITSNYQDLCVRVFTSPKTFVPLQGVTSVGKVFADGQPQRGYTGDPTGYNGEMTVTYYKSGWEQPGMPTKPGKYTVAFTIPDTDPNYYNSSSYHHENYAELDFEIVKEDLSYRPVDSYHVEGVPESVAGGSTVTLKLVCDEPGIQVKWNSYNWRLHMTDNGDGTCQVQVDPDFVEDSVEYVISGGRYTYASSGKVMLTETLREQPELVLGGPTDTVLAGDMVFVEDIGEEIPNKSFRYAWEVTGAGVRMGQNNGGACKVIGTEPGMVTVKLIRTTPGYLPQEKSFSFRISEPIADPAWVTVQWEEGGTRVAIPVADDRRTGSCIAAAYDADDRLLTMTAADFTQTENGFLELHVAAEQYSYLKLFGVEEEDQPFCDALILRKK